jgi:hypothetical protein
MEITEHKLISLGFEKVTITDEESQNGYNYSYYDLKLTEGIALFADIEEEMVVKAYDIPNLVIRDANVLQLFITTVKSCLVEN